jgi:hypothetical protein
MQRQEKLRTQRERMSAKQRSKDKEIRKAKVNRKEHTGTVIGVSELQSHPSVANPAEYFRKEG